MSDRRSDTAWDLELGGGADHDRTKIHRIGRGNRGPSHARWHHLRLPLSAAAVAMLFVPALAALIAGVNPGTAARSLLVQRSSKTAPWVDLGWGLLVLMAAGVLIILGLWREARAEGAGHASD